MGLGLTLLLLLSVSWTTGWCAQVPSWKSGERVLFPEQIAYLQMHEKLCKGNEDLILWNDYRCYREFDAGPCFNGGVIVFDRKLLRASCKVI